MNPQSIQDAIQALLEQQGSFQSGELAERVGLSRQGLHRHLVRELAEGRLRQEGGGRSTHYLAASATRLERRYEMAGLSEEAVFAEFNAWLGRSTSVRSEEANSILYYVVTEMVNNAIDHSDASHLELRCQVDGMDVSVTILDEGIGALESLRQGLKLEDHRHALGELSKGKATTQPDVHTGQGIFFSSKAVDLFRLTSNSFCWVVDSHLSDQTVESANLEPGTKIEFVLSLQTKRTLRALFEKYTHDFEFDTTRCVVRLFKLGTNFISRSEAKRLVLNLDRFREVWLDFQGVRSVGQGFVDEVFRVWSRAHPEVRLETENMNEDVEFMVRRGLGRGGPEAT